MARNNLLSGPSPWGSGVFYVSPVSFHEQHFVSYDQRSTFIDEFGLYQSRISRYNVTWAHYEGNIYRKIHRFSATYKDTYGLYEFTRSILSPAYRLGEFYATHLMGGALDWSAGDGSCKPSCLPIVVESPEAEAKADALREAVGLLWRESNWQINKETYTRFGTVLGDVFLYVEDDEARRRVRVRVHHPRDFADVDLDSYGNVKGYKLVEWRPDPRAVQANPLYPAQTLYVETCERVGESVVFRTYIEDESQPWDWRDYPDDRAPRVGAEWTEDYGFVPLVKVQHRDMGLGWGWSELHADLSRLHEIDDLASKLSDQIRKVVTLPLLFTGTAAPGATEADGQTVATNALVTPLTSRAADADDREGPRSDIPIFYNANDKADVKPLLGTLSIKETADYIEFVIREFERGHPELQTDAASSSGDASGRALRVARERAEAILIQRRPGYDDGLVRAQQMAISIGASKGYPGYEDFDAGSYERGELDHAIGPRPVFAVDEADKLELETAFGNALNLLVKAGLPLASALKKLGMSDEEVAGVIAERDAEANATTARQRASQIALFGGDGADPAANGGGDANGGNGPDGGGNIVGNGATYGMGGAPNGAMEVGAGSQGDGRFGGA